MAALVGCATTVHYRPTPTVVVTNQHWLDQVVYANCGPRVRMGVARGLGQTTLKLPYTCVDRVVSFTVDPIGSNRQSHSDAIATMVDDRLALEIPAVDNGYVFLSRVR
jgi:hypothetical protein